MYLPRIASFPTMMKMMMILLFDHIAINDGFADNDDHDDADKDVRARGRCLEMTLKCVTIAMKTFATHSSIWWIVFHYVSSQSL